MKNKDTSVGPDGGSNIDKSSGDGARRRGGADLRYIPFVALMAAAMCVVGPVAIPLPVSAVPITMIQLIIYLAVYLFGMRAGLMSCVIYLALGFAGLPVFAGFTGGLSRLAGPTGGYLIGYLLVALICGVFVDRFHRRKMFYVIGMSLGCLASYITGTAWLAEQAHLTFSAAFLAGVAPFIPGDVAKIAAAAVICVPARRLIVRVTSGAGRDGPIG
jgi:biotin transport system substrate-specific component